MNAAETHALSAQELDHLRSWTGRCESQADLITAAPLDGLAATLDRDDPPAGAGDPVAPLGHWLFFLPRHRQSALGPDGHARRGGFLPPVPLPRRMWAGGRLVWETDNPLRVGDRVERQSRIESVTHKRGRGGDLVFVLVRHTIGNDRGLALTEEHDIVYRAAPPQPQPADGAQAPPGPSAPPAPDAALAVEPAPWQRTVVPDDVLLFRYSALTFNGHRIHYDRRYVTTIEGYPGLVVHGPLIATLLVDLVRRARPGAQVARFAFRAESPLCDLHPFTLNARPAPDGAGVAVWAADHQGRRAVAGQLDLA